MKRITYVARMSAYTYTHNDKKTPCLTPARVWHGDKSKRSRLKGLHSLYL